MGLLAIYTSILGRTTRLNGRVTHTHTHTHTFNSPFSGLPRWASTRKVTPIWIFVKQETVSGSGISWAVCKSAPRSRQITTPAYNSVFTGRMPFLPPNQQRQSTEGRVSYTVARQPHRLVQYHASVNAATGWRQKGISKESSCMCMKASLVQISPKLHYTNIVANMLATPPTDETPTILQHVVGNNFTTNGQNFFTSQHLDM